MKWINIVIIISVIAINALANILPINNMNTGELSALYPNLFVPAGITFSIWSVIYLFNIGFVIASFFKAADKACRLVSKHFFTICILNMSWILAWHYMYMIWSVVIMLSMLITLISAYMKLQNNNVYSNAEKWLVDSTFSIYLAWISVATVANITALLVKYNFTPDYPEWWTAIMIIVVLVIVWIINSNKIDYSFTLVVIWALTGIIIKRTQSEIIYNEIILTCIIGVIFCATVLMRSKFIQTRTPIN